MNWTDIAVRAGKTFAQAFVAVLVAANIVQVGDITQTLIGSATAAGLAALLSFVQNTVLGAVSSGE